LNESAVPLNKPFAIFLGNAPIGLKDSDFNELFNTQVCVTMAHCIWQLNFNMFLDCSFSGISRQKGKLFP
jgi:hypothetical protein